MKLFTVPTDWAAWCCESRRNGQKLALVPTMGNLHEGHVSLIRRARQEADVVTVSIFVNPVQFGPSEDFAAYPRTLEADLERCRAEGADAVFAPAPAAMYEPNASVWVTEDMLSNVLCGASRPGHFRGVCTIVLKLFNLSQADAAVFGQKDAQQLRIVRKMVHDLNIPIKIIGFPTVREADGLAMSSRNRYLSPAERAEAAALFQALSAAKNAFQTEKIETPAELLRIVRAIITERAPSARVEYAELVDDATLSPLPSTLPISNKALLALAVRFGPTRLIDNIELSPPTRQ